MPDPNLRIEILEKMSALVTAAFGLVAALAWNDAIQSLFAAVLGTQSALAAKAGYAVLVTVVAVLLVLWAGKAINRAKERVDAP